MIPQTRPTPLNINQNQAQTESPSLPLPQKRKISATDFEIPDSDAEDDEDYGWAEDDEGAIPAMPPQWQGSEDILVPPPGELEADEEEVEDGPDLEDTDDGDAERKHAREIEDSEDELAL